NALSPRAISRHDFPAMCDDGLRKRPEPTPGMARPSRIQHRRLLPRDCGLRARVPLLYRITRGLKLA
ncbi:MAG TPA: hypothetical protein VF979_03870, partial [Streptosporangiaceae bacterium]